MSAGSALVSRSAELAVLQRALQRAARGRPSLLLLRGEAGIGKTRLLRALRRLAFERGFASAFGRSQRDVASSHLLAVSALMPLFGGEEGAPAAVREALARATSAGADADARTGLLFETTRAVLHAARSRPLLAIADDLQWADRPSLDLLTHLAYALGEAAEDGRCSLVLAVGFREPAPGSALGEVVARLDREESCESIHLQPFDVDDTRALMESLGFERPTPHLVDSVHETTRGNPLFIVETLRHLDGAGEIQRDAGWVTTRSAPRDLVLPRDVASAVQARAAALSPGCRGMLGRASVLGDRLDPEAVAALLGAEPSELDEWFEEAIARDLLVERGDAVEFAHLSIRQAFYGELAGFRRAALHLAAADHLEQTRPDAVAEIARHLVRAGERAAPERVATWTRRAADLAFDAADWSVAARGFEHTLEALGRGAQTDADLAALHLRTGIAFNRNMDPGACMQHYEASAREAERAGDVRGLALARTEQLRAEYTFGRVARGSMPDIEPLRAALDALGPEDGSLRGIGLDVLASAYWAARRPERAFELANEALSIGRDAGDDHLCGEVASSIALAHLDHLQLREALAAWEEGAAFAERIDDWPTAGLSLQRIPMVLVHLGRLDEAREAVARATSVNERVQNWGDFSLVTSADQALAAIAGDFERAESLAGVTIRMIARSHFPWAGPIALPLLAGVRVAQGAFQEARDALAILLEPGRVFADPRPMEVIERQLAPLVDAHERGSGAADDERRASFEPDHLDLWRVTRLCVAVELAWLRGAEAAPEGAVAALERATERGVVFTTGWLFLVPRIVGLAFALEGRIDDAIAQLGHAAKLAEELGARGELARVWLDHARLLEGTQGDAEEAAWLRDAGESLARELGMAAFVEGGREADHQAGEALLPGEERALALITQGRSASEAADELLLGPKSWADRSDAVYAKLDVDGPTGAAAAALIRPGDAGRDVAAGLPDEGPSAGPLTFMVSDIEGSTEMLVRLGNLEGRELLRHHNRITRRHLYDHRGAEVQQTGDGFISYFRSTDDALACATRLMEAFERDHDAGRGVRVRIGIHQGEAIPDEGRFVGVAVNLTARLCASAEAGQILVSGAARDAARESFQFVERGEQRLKGIVSPVALYELQPDLDVA